MNQLYNTVKRTKLLRIHAYVPFSSQKYIYLNHGFFVGRRKNPTISILVDISDINDFSYWFPINIMNVLQHVKGQ